MILKKRPERIIYIIIFLGFKETSCNFLKFLIVSWPHLTISPCSNIEHEKIQVVKNRTNRKFLNELVLFVY